MPNALTVSAVQPVSAPGNPPVGTIAPATTARAPLQSFTNPSLRLDSALGLVVIEFRNDTGAVTRSIPSQQKLDAYKRTGEVPPRTDEPTA